MFSVTLKAHYLSLHFFGKLWFSLECLCYRVSVTKPSLLQETDGQERRPLDKRREGRQPEELQGENTEGKAQTGDCRAENRAAPYQQNMFSYDNQIKITMANPGSWNFRLMASHCLPAQLDNLQND